MQGGGHAQHRLRGGWHRHRHSRGADANLEVIFRPRMTPEDAATTGLAIGVLGLLVVLLLVSLAAWG